VLARAEMLLVWALPCAAGKGAGVLCQTFTALGTCIQGHLLKCARLPACLLPTGQGPTPTRHTTRSCCCCSAAWPTARPRCAARRSA
jgi:hypothetical protein